MKKKILTIISLITVISLISSAQVFAGQWLSNANGWWWQNDDGTYPKNSWQWIDGNNDGNSECYYFNSEGYCIIDGTTPDGYTVDETGAWTVNGIVQTQLNEEEIPFGVTTKVRLANYGSDDSWKTEVDAHIGDYVEFQIEYKNLSNFRQPGVIIRNIFPKSLRYVENSTYLFNTMFPNGARIKEDTILTNGVNIGNYLPDANAYLRITVEVIGDTMADGENVLVDWGQAQAGPEGGRQIVRQDYAKVNVYKSK